eukprot:TRINITY_DN10962_c0_g1_i1.p2 TRINITY_DN10962_c0_g1~~TRINITY_DN10962_c0_g1_i1.p2  ORF type:complete len:160 (+),score=32.36 TRINITY_DN10962_c0_g1_i1:130-609(+)
MIRRPPRSTHCISSAASDVYKRQYQRRVHGNSLRALIKYLDHISDEDIVNLEIPTGVPLVYELTDSLKTVKHYYLEQKQVIPINGKSDFLATNGDSYFSEMYLNTEFQQNSNKKDRSTIFLLPIFNYLCTLKKLRLCNTESIHEIHKIKLIIQPYGHSY